MRSGIPVSLVIAFGLCTVFLLRWEDDDDEGGIPCETTCDYCDFSCVTSEGGISCDMSCEDCDLSCEPERNKP